MNSLQLFSSFCAVEQTAPPERCSGDFDNVRLIRAMRAAQAIYAARAACPDL